MPMLNLSYAADFPWLHKKWISVCQIRSTSSPPHQTSSQSVKVCMKVKSTGLAFHWLCDPQQKVKVTESGKILSWSMAHVSPADMKEFHWKVCSTISIVFSTQGEWMDEQQLATRPELINYKDPYTTNMDQNLWGFPSSSCTFFLFYFLLSVIYNFHPTCVFKYTILKRFQKD